MDTHDELMRQAMSPDDLRERRRAFLALLSSEAWREALAPAVIACQGYRHQEAALPDGLTLETMATALKGDEEKLQVLFEQVEDPGVFRMLRGLTRHLGPELSELALVHLRTAQGARAGRLLELLRAADPAWAAQKGTRRLIRRLLAVRGPAREQLVSTLAACGQLGLFIPELRQLPPEDVDEWQALGLSGIADDSLVDRALASFRQGPEALGYLLRLNPVPARVEPMMMAAARPVWLVEALELAQAERLMHPLLLPLAELGVRLGGRPMAMAGGWLNSTHLSIELLHCLSREIRVLDGRRRLDNMFWVRRSAPSADRALEMGRRGQPPDALDAAALVRQLRGDEIPRLVEEILRTPYPAMEDNLLHPLCTIYQHAARCVARLAEADDPAVAERARRLLSWPDVDWSEDLN